MTEIPEKVREAYRGFPPNWRLERLKFFADVRNSNVDKIISKDEKLVQLCNYTDVYYNDRITPDLLFMEGSATEAEIVRFQLKRGQVIITKDSEGWDDIGIPALVTEDMPEVLCGYHLSVFEPGPELDGGYLAWLCRTKPLNDQFKVAANGVTRFGLGQYSMKAAFILLPPLDTQKQIAQLLDEKTGQIDALIEKKRELLDRLSEKRQALITRAVTKGLNSDTPMKPSGIDWLGDIPAHWEIRGLTKCTNRIDYRGATPEKSSSGIFLVTAKNIKNGQIDYKTSKEYIPEGTYEYVMRRGKPKLGEVLFTTEAPLGEIARVDRRDIALAQRIIKFTTTLKDLTNDYLAYWMYSSAFRTDVVSRATGSTALGIKASKIVELRCLLPPKHEQVEISKFLDRDATMRNCAQLSIQASIGRLTEYRVALITAAVKGLIGGYSGD